MIDFEYDGLHPYLIHLIENAPTKAEKTRELIKALDALDQFSDRIPGLDVVVAATKELLPEVAHGKKPDYFTASTFQRITDEFRASGLSLQESLFRAKQVFVKNGHFQDDISESLLQKIYRKKD